MRLFALGLSALVLTIACSDRSLTGPSSPAGANASLDGADAPALVFGPQVFSRTTTQPVVVSIPLSSGDFVAPFRLVIENDGNFAPRVSSAEVILDGKVIFDPIAFEEGSPQSAEDPETTRADTLLDHL